jgi:hypothetical protein
MKTQNGGDRVSKAKKTNKKKNPIIAYLVGPRYDGDSANDKPSRWLCPECAPSPCKTCGIAIGGDEGTWVLEVTGFVSEELDESDTKCEECGKVLDAAGNV